MQSDGLLTMQEVSRMLKVPVNTLKRWRHDRVGLDLPREVDTEVMRPGWMVASC
jgi:hypothetical protein